VPSVPEVKDVVNEINGILITVFRESLDGIFTDCADYPYSRVLPSDSTAHSDWLLPSLMNNQAFLRAITHVHVGSNVHVGSPRSRGP
jgi:hypothetical protein